MTRIYAQYNLRHSKENQLNHEIIEVYLVLMCDRYLVRLHFIFSGVLVHPFLRSLHKGRCGYCLKWFSITLSSMELVLKVCLYLFFRQLQFAPSYITL